MSDDEDQTFDLQDEDFGLPTSAPALPWYLQQPWTGFMIIGATIVAFNFISRFGMGVTPAKQAKPTVGKR